MNITFNTCLAEIKTSYILTGSIQRNYLFPKCDGADDQIDITTWQKLNIYFFTSLKKVFSEIYFY